LSVLFLGVGSFCTRAKRAGAKVPEQAGSCNLGAERATSSPQALRQERSMATRSTASAEAAIAEMIAEMAERLVEIADRVVDVSEELEILARGIGR
jgi:RNA-splicing ligase RtcB